LSASAHKTRIIVSGILFWYPLAGVTYQFLHYLIGLQRLGYDVYYIEDSSRWIYDPLKNELSPDAASNVSLVAPILEAHGFVGRWAFRGRYPDGSCYGMTEPQILRLYREADALLNVTGAQELHEKHMGDMRLIYVESDPFALQVEIARGDAKAIQATAAYDALFSFGENLGAADCGVPLERFHWMPTRQPVVLDLWSNLPAAGLTYRTITTWNNTGSDVVYNGETYYWTKDREFEKFLELPLHRSVPFELAAGVDKTVKAKLLNHSWRQVDSVEISRDLNRYRSYIQESRAEFTVARDQYVRPRTGWFSDRSACYLAAGRPVITQETGFSKFIPTGQGLFAFSTMGDILAAIDTIEQNYNANCRAAREIAAEYFGAEKVLRKLMQRAGL
jgi:hypothetical protein